MPKEKTKQWLKTRKSIQTSKKHWNSNSSDLEEEF